MRYNEKRNLYIDGDFVYYRWSNKTMKLRQITPYRNGPGYLCISGTPISRILYETFIGEIPDGYEIDHIDTNKENNTLSNFRCVSHRDNMNNPKTKERFKISNKGKGFNKGRIKSEFYRKFQEYYHLTKADDVVLYNKERYYYIKHHKCSWE